MNMENMRAELVIVGGGPAGMAAAVAAYERGLRDVPVEIIIQLAKFYNTSTDYILGLTDCKKPYK